MVVLSLTAALSAAGLAGAAALVNTQAGRREAEWMAAHPPLGEIVTVEGRPVHAQLFEGGRDLELAAQLENPVEQTAGQLEVAL